MALLAKRIRRPTTKSFVACRWVREPHWPLHKHSCHSVSTVHRCPHTSDTWWWCWLRRSLYWQEGREKRVKKQERKKTTNQPTQFLGWEGPASEQHTWLGWSPWWRDHRGRPEGRPGRRGSACRCTSLTRQSKDRSSPRSTSLGEDRSGQN